ncbi:hypothetical protein [Streptomyces sp. SCL15-6]|uniref:hypothetical protein n=1 Tax=Streptomyces sp. SCL15-6 TaxID=2967222 RepID=UPI0029669A13|nr:hypothetical protein [Streptomyces sp. SCL15-6]
MADENTFAAVPRGVQQGGAHTDEIGDGLKEFTERYVAQAKYNEADPPWGGPDDLIGDAFRKVFEGPHAALTEALLGLSEAISKAGRLAFDSGVAFQQAQDDALETIHSQGGRRS